LQFDFNIKLNHGESRHVSVKIKKAETFTAKVLLFNIKACWIL